MRYAQLPLRLRVLILAQTAAAVALVWLCWGDPAELEWRVFLPLLLSGILAGAFKVDVSGGRGWLTLGFTVSYLAFLILGTAGAMAVGLSSTVAGLLITRNARRYRLDLQRGLSYRTLYNGTNCIVATAAMGAVYNLLGGTHGRIDVTTAALPILGSALVYYLTNTGGVSLAIGWAQGLGPATVFRNHFAWSWPGFLTSASISACLLWTYQSVNLGPSALLALPPAGLVYYFFLIRTEKQRADVDHMRELNRLNDAVIASLATAIDAKDRHTHQHTIRVREYALMLAQKLGVSSDELHAIRIASLLHDIGKIGIPEAILCKPGKLTSEEFEVIKSHVEIGAAILEQVQFPWPVVPVVRTHHERWDGLGYPEGLKGDEIPMGGRIISLVDVFDALTSERPYRRAIPKEEAIAILRANSGTQFDPRVVETFIDLLPDADAAIQELELAEPETPDVLQSIGAIRQGPVPMEGHEEEDRAVLQQIGRAAQENSRPEAFGPRLAEAIHQVAPFTTLALYITSRDERVLLPIYTSGLWSQFFEDMQIRVGEGVSGFVAERGEPVRNAAASLDLARRVRPGENLELNSTLSVPLRLNGILIGVLTLYHTGYSFYQPRHLEFLLRAGDYVAQALERGGWSEADLPLPREYHYQPASARQGLLRFLQGQVTAAQLREEEFSVLAVNVSDHGEMPDPRDSAEREQVVQALGRLIRATVREGDFVCRSEEAGFILVLPRCGDKVATGVAERLRDRLGQDPDCIPAQTSALEVGVSVYPRDATSAEALVRAAERCVRFRKGAPRLRPPEAPEPERRPERNYPRLIM